VAFGGGGMSTAPARNPRIRNLDSWLKRLKLQNGAHGSPTDGLCLMEAAAYVAGREHGDHPPCVSPVIASFGRAWNDALDDKDRQMLKPLIPDILNTATTSADEETRAWMATDWLVRTFTPAWLDLAAENGQPQLKTHADALRNLDALTSDALARKAQPIISASYSARIHSPLRG